MLIAKQRGLRGRSHPRQKSAIGMEHIAGEADVHENTTWADAEFVKYAIGSFLSCARTYAIQSEAVLPPTESTNVKPLASSRTSLMDHRSPSRRTRGQRTNRATFDNTEILAGAADHRRSWADSLEECGMQYPDISLEAVCHFTCIM